MKELDIATLAAVFQEMLGGLFWPLILLAALASVACLGVVLRDRGVVSRRLVRAQLAGVPGGLAAVALMFVVTNSAPRDFGGPVDWLLAAGIFAAGLIGTTIGVYAIMGLLTRRAPRATEASRNRLVASRA